VSVERAQREDEVFSLVHCDKLRPCYGRTSGSWEEQPISPSSERVITHVEAPVTPVSSRPHRTVRRPIRYQ